MPKTDLKLKQRGVTLVELIVTISVMAILATVAVPSYQDSIERKRLKAVVEALKIDMQFARTEAIKRSQKIYLIRKPDDEPWCYGISAQIDEDSKTCDCSPEADSIPVCDLRVAHAEMFSEGVNMESNTGLITINYRRGTIEAGNVLFRSASYAEKVIFSNTGRIRVCTPPGDNGLPDYPDC